MKGNVQNPVTRTKQRKPLPQLGERVTGQEELMVGFRRKVPATFKRKKLSVGCSKDCVIQTPYALSLLPLIAVPARNKVLSEVTPLATFTGHVARKDRGRLP